jgi:hypothetical protein
MRVLGVGEGREQLSTPRRFAYGAAAVVDDSETWQTFSSCFRAFQLTAGPMQTPRLTERHENTKMPGTWCPIFSRRDAHDRTALFKAAELGEIHYLWRSLLPDAGDGRVLKAAVNG